MVDTKLDLIRGCADHVQECVAWARPVLVEIVQRVWTGHSIGIDNFTDTVLVTLPRRDVRDISSREVVASAGRFREDDLVVEDLPKPYTSHGGGGFTEAQLRPVAPDAKTEIFYRLTGDIEGEYSLFALEGSDPVFWWMVLRRWHG